MSCVYVTAIYRVYDDNEYVDKLWERLKLLSNNIPLYIFCSKNDSARVEELTNIIPVYYEFNELDTYICIKDTKHLPKIRNKQKDTKNYMILINAKIEFIRRLQSHLQSQLPYQNPNHYIWLDAGISKIFNDPVSSFYELKVLASKQLYTDSIFIPGCWNKYTYFDIIKNRYTTNHPFDTTFFLNRLTEAVNWRFCGGFFIVPSKLVEHFANTVLQEIKRVRDIYDMAIWEVNIWASIEFSLPIQWEKGDHNESIYKTIPNFYVKETHTN